MAGLTKVTSGAITGLSTSATTDTTDASNITSGTLPTARLATGTSANKLVQLDSTGKLPAIDGSALTSLTSSQMPAGSIIQTVQGVMTAAWAASTTTLVPVGLTVAITTVSANSKVLVRCAFRAQMTNGADKGGHFVLRSSLDSYASNLTGSVMINDWGGWNQEAGALEYLHTTSAASGSTITYKLYGGDSRFGSALYVGDNWGYSGVQSRITAQEIKT